MSDLKVQETKSNVDRMNVAGDVELQAALRNFRLSVHEWSEQEMSRTRTIGNVAFGATLSAAGGRKHGWLAAMKSPIAAWSMGCVLAVTAVTMPLSVQHERQLKAQRQAAVLQVEQQKAAEAAARAQADAISDEELLSHVDSDVAKATPEALEPLASLMSDSTE
jgi:hypothetical protein